MLRALSAPYGAVRFMPTGGISPANLQGYLSLKSVFACGGSWMVKEELLAANDFGEITRLTRQAVR
jgi:2-dehydro-3-deoxyphosphogluconate aldolase/(4S)-4-hydroxy-2-oxoglutarate aldolase